MYWIIRDIFQQKGITNVIQHVIKVYQNWASRENWDGVISDVGKHCIVTVCGHL